MVDHNLVLACSFIIVAGTMYSMALANPVGLQLDFTLKVFGLRFLAGIFLLLAVYGFFVWKHYHKQLRTTQGNQYDVHRLQKQLLIQKMHQASDQELISLFVAYLEKFTTTFGAHSRNSLLTAVGFTDEEISHIKEVNYGKGSLDKGLKERILKQVTSNEGGRMKK